MASAIPLTSLLVWLTQVYGHDLVPLPNIRSDDLSLRSSRRIAFAVTQWQVTTRKRKSSLTGVGGRQMRRSRKIPVEESAEKRLRHKEMGIQWSTTPDGSSENPAWELPTILSKCPRLVSSPASPLDSSNFGFTHIHTIDRLDWMDVGEGPTV